LLYFYGLNLMPFTGLLLFIGGGAYVVIDKRSKGERDVQGSSSDDGNVTLLSSRQSVCTGF